MDRSAADITTYGAALDDLRARHNPLFAAIRSYGGAPDGIRQAHRVGVISADKMTAAIGRERTAALANIAALKGRTTALGRMGGASRLARTRPRTCSTAERCRGVAGLRHEPDDGVHPSRGPRSRKPTPARAA